MAVLAEKIYEQAIGLPIDERLAIIDRLLKSSNLSSQDEIDMAWSKEVELRFQNLKKGTDKLIPGEVVFGKIKKRFS